MKIPPFPTSTLAILISDGLMLSSGQAALIAHYTFDVDSSGTTPDSVGTGNFATLNQTSISSSAPRLGPGSLFMDGVDDSDGSSADGAMTNNTFTWTQDARTMTFWWKHAGVADNGTFISFGTNDGNGTRMDVKQGAGADAALRVEIAGAGGQTSPTDFQDGNWHFVAVTVPNGATMADIAWYVDGSSTDLNPSSQTTAVATGTGPLIFGDSIITVGGTQDRVPHGYLDDFQLYDTVLNSSEISFLYNNPGAVIPEPSSLALAALSLLILVILRRYQR